MKLLWSYLKRYRNLLILSLVLATVNQVFSLLDPQVFRILVDKYASHVGDFAQSDFLRGTGLLLLALVGVAFVSRVAKNFQDYFVNVIVQRLGARMYADSVSHSFSLPYAVFEDQRSGEFLQKLQKARTDAQLLIQNAINTLFLSLVGILVVVGYAFFVHWSVGLVFVLILPSLGIVTLLISRKIKVAQKQINAETASLAGATTETLRNVELVKSLGLEQQEISRLNDVNTAILALELKKVKLVRTLSFIQGTIINALRSGLMLLMLWLIYAGHISLGQFFTLMFYSFMIFNPLGELGNIAQNYQETKASMDRLGEILKIKPEPKPEHPIAIDTISDIAFHDVDFKYESADSNALKKVNVDIKASETVAFVGPSGSGKTTIVKLLVGLYKPTSGNVTINSNSVKDIDMEQLRNKMGLVSQDTQLFAGSIRDNLLFASPEATDAQCEEALRQSAAINIIERGGKGLDTIIGEGGLKLSGGEKQRLAIARALLRNPDLLIFDEATSSLDSLTEEEITQTIKGIKNGRPQLITVLVAHRLSTVAHSDRIMVLEKGSIIEQGTHSALLEQKGLYAALWRQQIASDEIINK